MVHFEDKKKRHNNNVDDLLICLVINEFDKTIVFNFFLSYIFKIIICSNTVEGIILII